MKRHILYLMATLFAGACLSLSSCSDSDDDGGNAPEPNFPQAVTATVEAGGSYDVDFDANLEWEANLSSDAAPWFWIQDGTQKVYKLRGTKGSQKIQIGVSELEEFDENRSCTLELTMGGQTRVIATITRGTVVRELTLYTALLDDAGDFAYNTDDSGDEENRTTYTYGTEPAKSIGLLWPEGRMGFMYPVKIQANFDWRLKSKPEWISNMQVSSGKAGQWVEIRIEGDVTKYPLDGDAKTIVFCAEDNENATWEYPISIPACRDIFTISGLETVSKYNAQAEYYNTKNEGWVPGKALGDVLGIEGWKAYVFAEHPQIGSDPYLTDEPSETEWIVIEQESWDTSAEGGVIQSLSFDIGVKENTGDARRGVVVVLPASLAAKITDPGMELVDANDVREEYKQYVATTIKQSAPQGPVSAVTPEDMYEIGTEFTKLSINSWILTQFNVKDGYKLTYTQAWSNDPESKLKADRIITGYKFYDYNFSEMKAAESWLTVRELKDGFFVDMDPSKDPTAEKSQADEGIAHMGFIVLSDATGDIAVIQCIYDENAEIGGGEEFSVAFMTPGSVSGATLTEVTAENLDAMAVQYPEGGFKEYLPMGTKIYVLKYTSASPKNVALTVSSYQSVMVMPYEGAEWLTFKEGAGNGQVTIGMVKPTGNQSKSGTVQFFNSDKMSCFIYCDPAF